MAPPGRMSLELIARNSIRRGVERQPIKVQAEHAGHGEVDQTGPMGEPADHSIPGSETSSAHQPHRTGQADFQVPHGQDIRQVACACSDPMVSGGQKRLNPSACRKAVVPSTSAAMPAC